MERPTFDEPEFARWRSEADRALQGARVQATAELHNWACFAAEQAAQLALKGLLHGVGRAPWGHDLALLLSVVREAGIALPADVSEAGLRVGRHYIAARCPDAHAGGPPGPHYSAADARDAVRDAEAIIAFVDRAWQGLHA